MKSLEKKFLKKNHNQKTHLIMTGMALKILLIENQTLIKTLSSILMRTKFSKTMTSIKTKALQNHRMILTSIMRMESINTMMMMRIRTMMGCKYKWNLKTQIYYSLLTKTQLKFLSGHIQKILIPQPIPK